jgi:putative ABC transport system ATP-binding protein
MTPVLEAVDLYRFFHAGDEEVLALRGVSLTVNAGEMIAVVGPSGSGKSTLLACVAGLDDPDGGTVQVAGHRISRRPERERAALRARHIGFLFQSGNLVAHLDVAQNVALAQRLAHSAASPRLLDVIAAVGLGARAGARPSQLSGGEEARAGLAVALANDPELLLADEPTGEVDRATAAGIVALLRERAAAGGAVVVVTHSADVADAADRTLALVDGRVTG